MTSLRFLRTRPALGAALLASTLPSAAAPLPQGCEPEWIPTFGGAATNGYIDTLSVLDDRTGAGPALYAGGAFSTAGGQPASNMARWDGQSWSPIGEGADDQVYCFEVFDDGSGPALYAGGLFLDAGTGLGLPARRIAKWNGQDWVALGDGLSTTFAPCYATDLCVFDDGSGAGPALYVAGQFGSAGDTHAKNIARWDGQGWSSLGGGLDAVVSALAVFDDGSGAGPALYAGGAFITAGGRPAKYIAKWDGQAWSRDGRGMNLPVQALAVLDDGSGPALYAGGAFTVAGGKLAPHVARWDGQSWSAVGTELDLPVSALAGIDHGSGAGPTLYSATNYFPGGMTIARWDGQGWSSISSGINQGVGALAAFDDSGAGSALFAGGSFTTSAAGDGYLAKWACPTIDELPGCSGNPAVLASPSSAAEIGGTLDVSLSASVIANGVGQLYLGLDGTDAAGCGPFVPGIGELLLAGVPPPLLLASGHLTAGTAAFALPVPSDPAIVGVHVALLGVAVGVFDPGTPLELSNGLLVTITQ
jgi:hypothetical protein